MACTSTIPSSLIEDIYLPHAFKLLLVDLDGYQVEDPCKKEF